MIGSSDSHGTENGAANGVASTSLAQHRNLDNYRAVIRESIIFFREGFREFQATGTFFPTWRWAASALIAPLVERRAAKGMETLKLRVLEAGPGTGSVTIHILKHLGPDDELIICEINARFLDALRKTLSTNEDFKKHESRVRFYNCAIQDLPQHEGKFDAIICAIPFLNLDRGTVEEIFSKFKEVSHERTSMTYYEYMALRSLGKILSTSQRRERLKNIDSFFKAILPTHLVNRADIYFNLLPTHVYRLSNLDRLQLSPHSVH